MTADRHNQMKITCPNCSASYQIPDNSVDGKSKSVRCANCSTVWTVPSESAAESEIDWPDPAGLEAEEAKAKGGAEPAGMPEPDMETVMEAGAEPDGVEAMGEGEFPDPEDTVDIEQLANAARIAKPKRKTKNRASVFFRRLRYFVTGPPAPIIAVLLVAACIVFRESIVRLVPDLAGAYEMMNLEVNLRGLEFNRVQTFRETEDGRPVLVVEGYIKNLTDDFNDVPAIRFAIRGEDAQEIYAWLVEPKSRRMRPGATLRFRTRVNAPPETAFDLQLRFVDRRNRSARL